MNLYLTVIFINYFINDINFSVYFLLNKIFCSTIKQFLIVYYLIL